jgi:hypothetical protein
MINLKKKKSSALPTWKRLTHKQPINLSKRYTEPWFSYLHQNPHYMLASETSATTVKGNTVRLLPSCYPAAILLDKNQVKLSLA